MIVTRAVLRPHTAVPSPHRSSSSSARTSRRSLASFALRTVQTVHDRLVAASLVTLEGHVGGIQGAHGEDAGPGALARVARLKVGRNLLGELLNDQCT